MSYRVMQVVAQGRSPAGVGVGLHRGTPGRGAIRLLGVGAGRPDTAATAGYPDSSSGRGAATLDDVHGRGVIALDVQPGCRGVFVATRGRSTTTHYRVDAEADFRLGGHRDYWRRRERHHCTRRRDAQGCSSDFKDHLDGFKITRY